MKIIQFALIVAVGAMLALAPAAQAQEPPAAGKSPEKGDEIRVKGCLMGPTLESVETVTTEELGKAAGPMTYQLRGDKDLLKQMRAKADGQQVEVSGILKSTLPQDDAIRSKKVGKTRITVGVGTPTAQPGVPPVQSALPVLEVKSYDATGSRCVR